MPKYNLKKTTIVAMPETTGQALERIQGDIAVCQSTLAEIEFQIQRIERAECDESEVKNLPNLRQTDLETKVRIRGLEKLLSDLQAQLLAEEQTALVEHKNSVTEQMDELILNAPEAIAPLLDLGYKLMLLRQERNAIDVHDVRVHSFKHTSGIGVAETIVEATKVAIPVVKYITITCGDKANEILAPLSNHAIVGEIKERLEHSYLSRLAQDERQQEEEKPIIAARLERAEAKKRLNQPAQSKAEKTTAIILAKREKERIDEGTVEAMEKQAVVLGKTEKQVELAQGLIEDMGVTRE